MVKLAIDNGTNYSLNLSMGKRRVASISPGERRTILFISKRTLFASINGRAILRFRYFNPRFPRRFAISWMHKADCELRRPSNGYIMRATAKGAHSRYILSNHHEQLDVVVDPDGKKRHDSLKHQQSNDDQHYGQAQNDEHQGQAQNDQGHGQADDDQAESDDNQAQFDDDHDESQPGYDDEFDDDGQELEGDEPEDDPQLEDEEYHCEGDSDMILSDGNVFVDGHRLAPGFHEVRRLAPWEVTARGHARRGRGRR